MVDILQSDQGHCAIVIRRIIRARHSINASPAEEPPVAKSQDHQKKQEKKKPEKTLKEKRQAKKEKKAGK